MEETLTNRLLATELALADPTPVVAGLDPSALDYKEARKFLPPALKRTDFEKEVLDLIEAGDFWQNARRYVGPLPAAGSGYAAGMEVLRKSFAPILKLREVLRRHVRGVIGREPHFEIVLPELTAPRRERQKREEYSATRSEVEQLADEGDDHQGAVWDERGEHSLMIDFVRRLRLVGKAYLRYDVPPGLLQSVTDAETGERIVGVSAADWQDAYDQMYVELAAHGAAHIHTDPATMQKTSFYSYAEAVPNSKKTRKCVQLSWLEKQEDGSKLTRVRIVRDDGTEDEWQLDTGGRLLLIEAACEKLITPDALKLQDILCSIATMIKINCDVAGFPQVTAIDIAPPQRLVENPDGTKSREAIPLPVGPRTAQFVYSHQELDNDGKPVTDADGKPIVRNGTMNWRAPVSSEPLRQDADFFEREIYKQTNQEHIVARKSANASAAMLVELRSDYADSLLETKPHFERALREVLHARLCAAAYLSGDEDALSQFKAGKVRVEAMLNAGPLSSEERSEILSRYEKGLLSKQTALIMLGVEDVDAELLQMKEEAREERGDGVPVVKSLTPPVAPRENPDGE